MYSILFSNTLLSTKKIKITVQFYTNQIIINHVYLFYIFVELILDAEKFYRSYDDGHKNATFGCGGGGGEKKENCKNYSISQTVKIIASYSF